MAQLALGGEQPDAGRALLAALLARRPAAVLLRDCLDAPGGFLLLGLLAEWLQQGHRVRPPERAAAVHAARACRKAGAARTLAAPAPSHLASRFPCAARSTPPPARTQPQL